MKIGLVKSSILFLVFTVSLSKAQIINISGKVIDAQTKETLPSANIRLHNKGIGTITNSSGEFQLKIPHPVDSDSLEISFVGYKTKTVLISVFASGVRTVPMEPATKLLMEVTVRAKTGLDIIKEALAKIAVNYDTIGKNLQAFYREEINLGRDSISYNEAVLDIYKSSYTKLEDQDQIKVLKGRKKKISWGRDPLLGWLNLSNGARGSVGEDFVKYRATKNTPFNEHNFKYYDFVLKEVINQSNKSFYVIGFSPSKRAPRSKLTLQGDVYVDLESLAFYRIDWKITEGGVRYLNNHRGLGYRIGNIAYQTSLFFSDLHEVISYTEINSKWYLKEVQRQLTAKVSSPKRKMKNRQWKANTLLVITDVKAGEGKPITEGDIFGTTRSMGMIISNDEDNVFWENYNVVQPKAVDTIAAKPTLVDSVKALIHVSNRQNGFTRADTLRGKLTPLRTCYDVTFYHLDVTVRPESKSIEGSTIIRFKAVQSFTKIQIDLYANMKIEKILYQKQELPYVREFDAVFISFPSSILKGSEQEIKIYYSGIPQAPNLKISMNGGFLWSKDKNGKPWIQVVCQGSGASLWWPNKDHLSDEPDSARITITIPKGLMSISNGRLRSKIDLPTNQTRFDWFVSYPINNYNITLNIGDYAHSSDQLIRGRDTLSLDYYFMPYNIEKAKRLFEGVKPMLKIYEKYFGKYPFSRDGFTLMESLYPMEHQSAVSIGKLNESENIQSTLADSIGLRNLMWHEVSHEWWGNNVSVKDLADFWIHESFATYCESLMQENLYGFEAASASINSQTILNKEPVIGVYDVNHIFYDIGDIYNKGFLMLHTLRHVINNDSLWFSVLRGIQDQFKLQTITTFDIVDFINQKTKNDYTYLFDQYLRYTSIPIIEIKLQPKGSSLAVEYRWKSDVENFRMPIKITTAKDRFTFVYPTPKWQTMILNNMTEADFEVDETDFHVEVVID